MTMCLCLKDLPMCQFLKDIIVPLNDMVDNVSMSERYCGVDNVSMSERYGVFK